MKEPSAEHAITRSGPSFKRLLLVLAFCLALGGGVHFISAINDNSTQNAVTLLACGIAVIAFAVWFYRTLAVRSRVVAALATVTLLAIPIAALRIRGFTGEIVPQFEYRFAGNRSFNSDPVSASAVSDSGHVAQTSFREFLGSDRNGVIARREFEVPASNALQPLWQQPIGDGWAGFAIAGDRCITLEQRGQEECVTCYRLADGALLWINKSMARHSNRIGGIGPRSTPTIADDKVYTQGATGIVQCLDLVSGETIWRQDLLELAGWSQDESEAAINWGRAGSPLLVDQLCVVPFGAPDDYSKWTLEDGMRASWQGRSLIALDVTDGSVRWTGGNDQISFASPMLMTLAGIDQIVIVNESSVSGHAIGDGRQLWSTPWRGQSNGAANCAAALQVDDSAFLVGKAYGTGSAVFQIENGQESFTVSERWKRSGVLKTKFTHACIVDGFAYGLSDGMLECVDLADGKRMWAQPRGARYGHGQMILVEDILVVQTESGDVAFVSARNDRFEEQALVPALTSKTWNIPAVAGDYLAVRNDAEAVLFQLPPRQQNGHSADSQGHDRQRHDRQRRDSDGHNSQPDNDRQLHDDPEVASQRATEHQVVHQSDAASAVAPSGI
jgi:outer membrane protein assembly factor BamB